MFVDGENLADPPHVPADLMAVLRRAMAHDPRDRYLTAADLQSALASIATRTV
jgi:hypothetical protein